jgi:hypothetical protein
MEARVLAIAVSSSFARAIGELGEVLARYLRARSESSRILFLMSEGTPGEMDLKRGAVFVGTLVVSDLGGGRGI